MMAGGAGGPGQDSKKKKRAGMNAPLAVHIDGDAPDLDQGTVGSGGRAAGPLAPIERQDDAW